MIVEVGKFTFPADFVILEMEEDSKVPLILGRPFLHTADAVIRVKQKQLNLGVGTERMIFNIDSSMKHSYSNDDTCFSIDVINEILEEDFDALLDEGSKILHSIKGTLLEEEIFTKFDEFMAMNADENFDFESDTEEPPFEKITINTNYKIKTSLEEPPMDLKLKPLPDNLEYVFLEEPSFLPVIISCQLSKEKKNKLVSVLKKHKEDFSWKTTDIPGICPLFCKHKIQVLDDKKPVVQKQRRLNPNMQEVVKKEIIKLLDTSIIYPIADSLWVSPIHCIPKKGGVTVITNQNDELVPTRIVTGWRVCINYHKLNEATVKDHFPLPFMDQMLERLAGNKYFCFLDGFSGYFQIPIDPNDQEKTMFICPFGTYAFRGMPFGLCNAPTTFQRCMMAIFHDMIEESVERCKDAHLVLNWEKCHFMVKEGIVLRHKVSSAGLEVDKAKIDVISKLPPPTNIKDNPAIWSRKLDDALWAFRTAYKTPTGTTPYKLIYGKNCHLPFEIEHHAYLALKNCNPDLIVAGSLEDIPSVISLLLHKEFDMTDLGALNYFLGILVTCDSTGMFLSQKKYAMELLDWAHMASCNPTRTLYNRLQLYASSTSSLVAYSDADWAGCPTTRRSTLGYCVFFGDNLLSWSCKRQYTLSRSCVEVEYRGVANVVAETTWLRNLLCELHMPLLSATLVYCDNIDIHFVRDMVAHGHVRVLHVPSRYQYADIFTKGPLETDIQERTKRKPKTQNLARNGKDKVKSKPKLVKVRKSTPTKSKVNQVKKIQLKGLKLTSLKLYYENKRQGLKLQAG
ncbi:reverse transcriptase domain-containing protein [Tanacetum coccineum]